MALPGFIRFSVSASKMKGVRNTPLFQLLQSMSAAPAANKKNLEVFYEKFGNLKNAAKNYKYRSKNFIVSNIEIRYSDLDIGLLLALVSENRFNHNLLSIKDIERKYNFSRGCYYSQVKKLSELKFCCYSPHHRESLFDRSVFDNLSVSSGFIDFSFSEEFEKLVLKKGKNIFLPFSALSSSKYKRNAFSTIANVFFFSEERIQRAIANGERREIKTTFGMYDFLEYGGLDLNTIRLDELLNCVCDVLMDLIFNDEPNYIKSVRINNKIVFTTKSFEPYSNDSAVEDFFTEFKTKNQLLASEATYIFDAKQ